VPTFSDERSASCAQGNAVDAKRDVDDAISHWLERSKAGDEQAFEQLWQHYYSRLIALARATVVRSRVPLADEDDVVQSALASFYFRAKEGRFPDLHDRTGLWKLLLTITLCKARAILRKEHNRRQNLLRLSPRTGAAIEEPSPELAAEWADQVGRLMSELDDPLLQRIALAKLEGYRNDEIASQVGKSVPTVERKLHRIRDLWSDHSEGI
jgi:RNA polymerase sigma factor (sigma-70 family)